jgi:hypothetical protein
MDPRERFADPEETLRAAFQGLRAAMWTALPGYFVSFNTDDPGNITAVVQPGVKGVVRDLAGNAAAVICRSCPTSRSCSRAAAAAR